MTIPLELFVTILFAVIAAAFALLTTILGGFVWLNSNLKEIRDCIADIREDRVSHDVCQERRDRCPCVRELAEIKGEAGPGMTHKSPLPHPSWPA